MRVEAINAPEPREDGTISRVDFERAPSEGGTEEADMRMQIDCQCKSAYGDERQAGTRASTHQGQE